LVVDHLWGSHSVGSGLKFGVIFYHLPLAILIDIIRLIRIWKLLMTKEQIEMLRTLIRGEIEEALQNENDCIFAFEQEKSNNQGWEFFKESFNVI
jgi:hypothetical protein